MRLIASHSLAYQQHVRKREKERDNPRTDLRHARCCVNKHLASVAKGWTKVINAALIYPRARLCPLTKTTPWGGNNIMTQFQVLKKVKGEKKMPPVHNITCGRPPFFEWAVTSILGPLDLLGTCCLNARTITLVFLDPTHPSLPLIPPTDNPGYSKAWSTPKCTVTLSRSLTLC